MTEIDGLGTAGHPELPEQDRAAGSPPAPAIPSPVPAGTDDPNEAQKGEGKTEDGFSKKELSKLRREVKTWPDRSIMLIGLTKDAISMESTFAVAWIGKWYQYVIPRHPVGTMDSLLGEILEKTCQTTLGHRRNAQLAALTPLKGEEAPPPKLESHYFTAREHELLYHGRSTMLSELDKENLDRGTGGDGIWALRWELAWLKYVMRPIREVPEDDVAIRAALNMLVERVLGSDRLSKIFIERDRAKAGASGKGPRVLRNAGDLDAKPFVKPPDAWANATVMPKRNRPAAGPPVNNARVAPPATDRPARRTESYRDADGRWHQAHVDVVQERDAKGNWTMKEEAVPLFNSPATPE